MYKTISVYSRYGNGEKRVATFVFKSWGRLFRGCVICTRFWEMNSFPGKQEKSNSSKTETCNCNS